MTESLKISIISVALFIFASASSCRFQQKRYECFHGYSGGFGKYRKQESCESQR